jgi:hypothetical protein
MRTHGCAADAEQIKQWRLRLTVERRVDERLDIAICIGLDRPPQEITRLMEEPTRIGQALKVAEPKHPRWKDRVPRDLASVTGRGDLN